MIRINIVRTKEGLPAYWEKGGGNYITGEAYIVAGSKGEALVPAFIDRAARVACGEHALFVIKEGYHIIHACLHGTDFTIRVQKIVKIKGREAVIKIIAVFSQGKWDKDPPKYLNAAIEAAKEKATRFHCRDPIYYDIPK